MLTLYFSSTNYSVLADNTFRHCFVAREGFKNNITRYVASTSFITNTYFFLKVIIKKCSTKTNLKNIFEQRHEISNNVADSGEPVQPLLSLDIPNAVLTVA